MTTAENSLFVSVKQLGELVWNLYTNLTGSEAQSLAVDISDDWPHHELNGFIPIQTLFAVIGFGVVILIAFVLISIILHRIKLKYDIRKMHQEQIENLEITVAKECRDAFSELQTVMTDFSDLYLDVLPFLDYRTYTMNILFPNVNDPAVLQRVTPESPDKKLELRSFHQLIMNKSFLLHFIRTLEGDKYFSMRDRVNVSSLIMVALQGNMGYCTDILKILLAELIEKSVKGKDHPKLLLRRTESVAEKMLSSWFTFMLHKYLREHAGKPLFLLFRAIKQQIDMGPVDAITSEVRYSLSEEKVIRQLINFDRMTVYVSISQAAAVGVLDPNIGNVAVKVLNCDTISQVKEKALDTIYRATPFSQRPSKHHFGLVWRKGTLGSVILYDEDVTTVVEGEWKKRNTLEHYQVPDGAFLDLVSDESSVCDLSIFTERNNNKPDKSGKLGLNKFSSSRPFLNLGNRDPEQGTRAWHLVKRDDKEGKRSNKMVSEIYLTRLLATKCTLQKFVDDLFGVIFRTQCTEQEFTFPRAIKYIFDFLDKQALKHGISDPEVVHTWKSNALPLRFWVNLIKNPNFVFDIHKSEMVDSCLTAVAQTFMDSCSTSDHKLGKDSPSSKLLYAKDIPRYKKMVRQHYSDIKELVPPISDQEMKVVLAAESKLHATEFNTNRALEELNIYAKKYKEKLMSRLKEDFHREKQRLSLKLELVPVKLLVTDL